MTFKYCLIPLYIKAASIGRRSIFVHLVLNAEQLFDTATRLRYYGVHSVLCCSGFFADPLHTDGIILEQNVVYLNSFLLLNRDSMLLARADFVRMDYSSLKIGVEVDINHQFPKTGFSIR